MKILNLIIGLFLITCMAFNSISQTLCKENTNFVADITWSNNPGPFYTSSLTGGTSTKIDGKNILIKTDVVIDNYHEFKNCVIKIDGPHNITVEEENFLKLDGTEIFRCDKMWEGIFVDKGSIRMEDSHIEDAEYAIRTDKHKGLIVINSTFNRNFVGIRVRGDFGRKGSGRPTPNIVALTNIYGTTFECTENLFTEHETAEAKPAPDISYAGIIIENGSA